MEDLTGKIYGRLTVTGQAADRKERRYWECICICGNKRIVAETHLKSSHTRSCGCLVKDSARRRTENLVDQTFGRLTVLSQADSGKDGVRWLCRCECGKEILSYTERLKSGHTRSCGCLQLHRGRQNFRKNIHFVDGTCVELIRTSKITSDNKSGYKGVYMCENGRFRAAIQFKGVRYDLGRHHTVEEALEVREKAREQLWGTFLREYDYI